MVEFDTRIGRVMDKPLRELGLDKNTLVFFMTDNGATGRHCNVLQAYSRRCGKKASDV